MSRLIASIMAALAFLMLPVHSTAQQTSHRPVVANFNGSGALVMPANEALDINGSGTIEFWVSAKWQGTLNYDPAIMAYSGRLGPRFAIHMSGDKQGLGLYAGQFYDGVNYNFADGLLHHVALITAGNSTDIIINGVYQDTLGYTFADLPADDFTIGAIGAFSPFIGEIGQIRIWSVPVEQDVLNSFSLRPLSTQGSQVHPDLEFLTGISAFGNPDTGGFIFIGDADMPNLTE